MSHDPDRCKTQQAFAILVSGDEPCPLYHSCFRDRPFYTRLVGNDDHPHTNIEVREALVREIAENGLNRPDDARLDQLVQELIAMRSVSHVRSTYLLDELATGDTRQSRLSHVIPRPVRTKLLP